MLLLNKNGLANHRTDAARPQESGNRNHEMDENDDEIVHSVVGIGHGRARL